jgi:hypothetical protein
MPGVPRSVGVFGFGTDTTEGFGAVKVDGRKLVPLPFAGGAGTDMTDTMLGAL